MHAVGQALDLVIRDAVPRGPRRLAVQLAHRVRAVRVAERERGHVELAGVAVHAGATRQDVVDRQVRVGEDRPRDTPHEVRIEALVAGRHGRVDGEDAVAADVRPRVVGRGPGRDVLAGPLRQQECGVALVQVPDRRAEAQCPDGPDPADAEHEFLVQSHLAAADVQDVGDRTILDRVLRQVRVEQQDRHAAHLDEPDGDRQVAPGQLHRHGQRQAVRVLDAADRQSAQVVVRVVVLLVPVGVDRLAEVAVAIEQAHAERRQGHVAERLHVVAGEDPEAARVDAERLVEAVLRAEVGDRPGQLVRVLALEPVVGAVRHVVVERGEDVVVLGQELRVVEQSRPLGGPADDRDRVAIAVPGPPVDEAPQPAGAGVPRPVHVVRQSAQPFEARRQGERRRGDGWDLDGIHERR